MYFQYVRSLAFTDNPNYNSIKAMFQASINDLEKSEKFSGFDWEKLPEFKPKQVKAKSAKEIQESMLCVDDLQNNHPPKSISMTQTALRQG